MHVLYMYIIKPIEKALGYKIIIIVKEQLLRTAYSLECIYFGFFFSFSPLLPSVYACIRVCVYVCVCMRRWYIMDSKRSFLNT